MTKLKLKLIYDRRSVGQFVLVSYPFGINKQILISLSGHSLSSSFCTVTSLTRGEVCNLQCNHALVRVAQDP
jgi:hypothetical protein